MMHKTDDFSFFCSKIHVLILNCIGHQDENLNPEVQQKKKKGKKKQKKKQGGILSPTFLTVEVTDETQRMLLHHHQHKAMSAQSKGRNADDLYNQSALHYKMINFCRKTTNLQCVSINQNLCTPSLHNLRTSIYRLWPKSENIFLRHKTK